MGDKSPRKQNQGKRLSVKEKKAKKQAKKLSKSQAGDLLSAKPTKAGQK
jgi:hypothetical protein